MIDSDFILFSFFFIFFGFILDIDKSVMVTQVTKHDGGMTPVTLTVTQSYDIKNIKSTKLDDIIQYSNNILAL